MNGSNSRMLFKFMPELIGVWIAIISAVLTVSVMKSHYCAGLNLLETTRCEALFNRIENIAILVVVFFGISSIGVRSRIKYGGYFWPAAFMFGFIIGGVFWTLYIYSESHTLIGKNFFQIGQIVIIPGVLFSGLCGVLSTLLGLAMNYLARIIHNNA